MLLVLDGILNERIETIWQCSRERLLGKSEVRLTGQPHPRSQVGLGRLQVVLRLDQKEFGVSQVYVRKADVEHGLEPVGLERCHFVRYELAGCDSLYRNLKHGSCALDVKICTAGGQQDIRSSAFGFLILRLRPEFGHID